MNKTNNQQKRTNTSRPNNKQQVKPKVDYKNPDPNAAKGCLSCMLTFWFRSAVFSLAIYLALRCLGLVGGNDLVLKRESLEGPVTFASQEYELTDADVEAFTALMNEDAELKKEVVYTLGK